MSKETAIQLFERKQVRSMWDDEKEKWYFSIGALLTESVDPQAYWRKSAVYSLFFVPRP